MSQKNVAATKKCINFLNKTDISKTFYIVTAGNVVRGNREVMQSESSRELPNMIDGIRQNVNNQVSFHELYFYSIAAKYICKRGNTIPFSIFVCIRNE